MIYYVYFNMQKHILTSNKKLAPEIHETTESNLVLKRSPKQLIY